MNLTSYLAPLAALILGAVVATLIGNWRVRRARRDAEQDLDNARRWRQEEVAAVKADLAEATNGWRAAYDKGLNLQQQLADEQRRLDAADRDRAALRGQLEDYARAWSKVPQAWRADVIDLERVAPDDVWAPPLEPSPVLVKLVADGVRGEAPGLPDEWEPESFTQWIKKYPMPAERKTTPVPSVRGVRGSKYKRKAVGR